MENFWIIIALLLMAAAGFLAGRAWEFNRLKDSARKGGWDVLEEEMEEYHCTEEAPDFRAEVHDGAEVLDHTSQGKRMFCRYCGVKWEEAPGAGRP